MIDPTEIESIFRLVCREVWIITSAAGRQRGGLAATWVSPASIDRDGPVILVGVAPNHFTAELMDASRAFAAHLLRQDQSQTAFNFAIGSGRERDKFANYKTTTDQTGSPLLEDSLAWLDCRIFARLATGDRNYYWADVVSSHRTDGGSPLNDRDLFATATEKQKNLLLANRDQDVQLQQPWQEQWRNQMPPLLRPA